jgi:putative ABC transport system permease protein
MFTATLRGMLAHKLRLVLTTASIALGVAFLAGTLVLTDTMGLAFDQLFGKVSAGTDAVVRAKAAFTATEGTATSRGPVAASLLDDVTAVAGVRAAEGAISGYALLTDNAGRAIVTNGGAPTLGFNLPGDEKLRGDVDLLSGVAPRNGGEVAIDATSAQEHAIALGSTISILFQGAPQKFTVVGTVGFGGEKNLGGTTSAYFDTKTAQKVLGQPGFFDTINVSMDSGVNAAELTRRLSGVVPAGVEAVTGVKVAKESADAASAGLKITGILFMTFAAIALFVGAFIIWNTFTMIVSQRSREIALLRAIGATRRQVMRSLLLEALLVGVGASVVGVVLGVGVAAGLRALMDLMGFSLPSTSLQLQASTIWVGLLVGTLVTVVAALVPARRATTVLPVEALRESTPGAQSPSRRRALIGLVITVAGVGAVLAGLYADAAMAVFGLGLLAALVGIMVLMPVLVRPLASLIATPLRLRGLPGELAKQNAIRNPRRTASTAAALMIGLTLVVSMSVFASSLKASFGDVLSEQTDADLYVTASSVQGPGFSPSAIRAVQDVPGIQEVSASAFGQAQFDAVASSFSAVDPKTADAVMNLNVSEGALGDLGEDGAVVSKTAAAEHGWKMGGTLTAEFPTGGGKHSLNIVGIYDGKGWITDDVILSLAAQKSFTGPQLLSSALLTVTPGSDKASVKRAVADALAAHPDAQVLDQKGFEKQAGGFIDQLLAFVTVMLLLAVLIALLGIVNTLALSVFERTRELGLLRAVGMTRAQVRAMVRWESAVISLIGALTGAGLGIGIGLALSQALKDQGIKAISVPVPQLALYISLAAVAGVLAAVGPARSAAKVDVLRAVVTD